MSPKWNHWHQKHHRKMRSHGGSNHPSNISLVKPKRHAAFHLLFANWGIRRIVDELNNVWLDPEFQLVVKRRTEN